MTDEEKVLVERLAVCFVEFMRLPEQHPNERAEFAQSIHRLQDLVAARSVYRVMGWTETNRGRI